MEKVLARLYIRKGGVLYRWLDVYIRKDGELKRLRRCLHGVCMEEVLYVSGKGKVIKRVRRFQKVFDRSFS